MYTDGIFATGIWNNFGQIQKLLMCICFDNTCKNKSVHTFITKLRQHLEMWAIKTCNPTNPVKLYDEQDMGLATY